MNEWDAIATFDDPKKESWDSVATFDPPARAESWDDVADFGEASRVTWQAITAPDGNEVGRFSVQRAGEDIEASIRLPQKDQNDLETSVKVRPPKPEDITAALAKADSEIADKLKKIEFNKSNMAGTVPANASWLELAVAGAETEAKAGGDATRRDLVQNLQNEIAQLEQRKQALSRDGVGVLLSDRVTEALKTGPLKDRVGQRDLLGDIERGFAGWVASSRVAFNDITGDTAERDEWRGHLRNLPQYIPGSSNRSFQGGADNFLRSAAEGFGGMAPQVAAAAAMPMVPVGATGAVTVASLGSMGASAYGQQVEQILSQVNTLRARAKAAADAGMADVAKDLNDQADSAEQNYRALAGLGAGAEVASELIFPEERILMRGAKGVARNLAEGAGGSFAEGVAAEVMQSPVNQAIGEPSTVAGVLEAGALEAAAGAPFIAAGALRRPEEQASQPPTTAEGSPTVDQRIETLGKTSAEALAQQAALNDPAANALIQTAEQVAQAPDTSLTVAALEQASGEVALQAALAEADRLKFGRPEEPDVTETAPVAEISPEADLQESAPVTAEEVLPAPLSPVSEGATDADFVEAESEISAEEHPESNQEWRARVNHPPVTEKVSRWDMLHHAFTERNERGDRGIKYMERQERQQGKNLSADDRETNAVDEYAAEQGYVRQGEEYIKLAPPTSSSPPVALSPTVQDQPPPAAIEATPASQEVSGIPPAGSTVEAGAVQPAPEEEIGEREFSPDDELIMRSPFTGDDTAISFRGLMGDGKAVVWTGKSQMAVPLEWLRRKGDPAPSTVAPKAGPVAEIEQPPAPVAAPATPEPKTKAELLEALAGKVPADYAARQRRDQLKRALAKKTVPELREQLDDQRKSDAKFKQLQATTRENIAPVRARADAAGNTWRSALIKMARESGIGEYTTMPDNTKGEEVYRLAERLASFGKAPATPTVKDQVTAAAKPIVQAAQQRGQKQGAAMTAFVELLAPAVEAKAKNFTGVSFVKAAENEAGASLNSTTGALEIDINRLASHVQSVAIGNRETMEAFLDEILREEVHHRGFVALYGTPDGKKAVDDVWTALPDKFKTESASAYFAARGGGKFNTDLQAKAEFFRQYGEKPEFAARVERYMADAGLLGKWRKLLEAFLASLEKLRTDPQFAALVKQIEGVQAGIRDALERIQGAEPSAPAEAAAEELSTPSSGQARAKAGGEFGANGEWYAGGEFIAKTDMPKKHKERIHKAATGREQVEPGFGGDKWAVPPAGKLPILARLVGSYMGPDGKVNEEYINYQKLSPEYAAQVREAARRFTAGERYLDVTEFPLIANFTDGARMLDAGMPIPGALLDKLPADIAAMLQAKNQPLSTVPGPTDAELRQQLAEDAALLEGRSKIESEATAAEKEGPTQATQDGRVYKDGEPVGPFYRAPLPDELKELTVQRMLDTSATLSGGMGADYGKQVMAYIKGGPDLPGIPHTIVFQQNLALSLKHDSALRDRLGLKEAETVAVVDPLISTLGTQAGRTLQAMSGGNLYGPLAELAEEVQAGPKKGLREIGVDDEAKLADDIKEDVKTQRVEAAKKVADTVKQTNGYDLIGDVMELWPEAKRKTLAALKAKLQYLSALKARLAAFSLKSAPGPGSGNDVAYLAAVESGDMETAQRMVDEAAKKAGYTTGPVFHGTNYEHDTNPNGVGDSRNAGRPNDGQAGGEAKEGDRGLGHAQNRQVPSLTFPFQVFDPSRRGSETGRDPRFSGFHFTAYPNYAEQYGKNVGRFLLRVEEWGRDGWMESNFGNDLFDVAVRDPSQIKSADAVTRDAKGNVIPLSQRFNPESDSILYSVPGDPNYIAEDISEEELRKEIAKVMGEVDNLVHEISGKKKRKPKTPEQVEGDGQRMVDEMEEAQARATFHAWVAGAEQEGVASFEELMVNAIDPGGFNRDAFALSLSQKFKDVDPEFIDEVTNKIADAIEGKEEAAEADSEKPDYDGRAKRIVGSAIAEDSTTDYTPVIDPMTRAIKQRLKDEITATEFAERMEKLEVEPMTAFALNRKVEADIAKRKAEAFRRKTEADKKRETEKGERDATGEIDRLAKQLDDIEPAKKPGSELKKLTEAFKKFEIGETGLRDGLATLNVKPATANKLVQLLTLNRQRQALHTWTTIRQSVAKAREDAIKRAVTALKPAKPRDLPKRNKFVNTLIRALESGVLDSQHVRDAFAEAYELHGLTTERLEKLGAILRQAETLPDGMVRQTLRKQAFAILNEIAPASRTMSALYQNLMGGVLGGVSTITAQFSGLSRVLNPFQGAWQFMAMAGGNPVTNPATFFKIWGQYMKQAWNTSSMMRAGVEGTLSTGSLGLGVSPSSLVNVQPNEMSIASLSPSELYKMRIGRRGLMKGLLGTVPESPLRRNVKSAILFPSWLASRSFNLIGSAEAWSGAIDQNMAFEAILMKKLMDDGMPTQKAWNKVRDLMSPKTSAVMWQEAMAQAEKELESKLVSKHALRQRAEEIVQDKLDEEHKVKLRNRNREVGAWLNFKSDPLTAVGSWFSLDVMAKAPTPVKMIFLFSRFFSNVIERAIFNSPLGFINMSKESAEKGALNPRQKRIEAIFGSLEQYRQYRNGLATSSVMSTFVMGTAMALAWGMWKFLDEDDEDLPPPFWITGATPPSSPYAMGRQLGAAGWWAPSSFFLRIPGTKIGIALNYVQANPELAITLSAIGNIADRIMFPEMLTYSTDQRTGERTKSAFKTYVQPLVNAVAAPATRSTYATFSQAVQRALEGNVQSLTKLLGRPIGETATATVLGGPIVRDIAKLTKPDVPKASQDAKQAFLSGIPFADVAGLDVGLPMLNQWGEKISNYPYFPFVSAQQNSSPEVQRAAKILNDSGITKEGPQEWMIGPDVVELAGGDGKRYLLSLDERAEVLGEIGRRFAEGVNAKETKIRATEDFPEKKKIVEKVMEDSRKTVLRRWSNRVSSK